MANEKRFFSEEEIMVELYDRVVHGSPAGAQFANAFSEFLKEIPTVDAVEVVRCKDCKHWVKSSPFGKRVCWFSKLITTENEFCSSGGRRTDNG